MQIEEEVISPQGPFVFPSDDLNQMVHFPKVVGSYKDREHFHICSKKSHSLLHWERCGQYRF